jgi:transposase
MLNQHHINKVYLALGPTDLRKSINGLFLIVQESFKLNPFSHDLFVFCNRKQDKLKILEAFLSWLKIKEQQTLPKSGLSKAIKYCLNQWPKLEAFLLDGRLEISNNRAERAIKPFVIGRKNFLFSKSVKGATASAITYSIIETAKANDLVPFFYLKYLFEKLPNIDLQNIDELDELLPWSQSIPEECRIPHKK